MTAADPSGPRPVRAPRGTALTCRGWPQEAAMRMLMNNLDPEVAEHPDELVVYGGSGRAARSWPAYDAIVRTLTDLQGDETLLVQSGKPVGVMRTHEWAPRVLIANSNLVPQWATWEEFRRLESLGLTMYGQMTAGSWIYIGTQGILQGTYETFAAVAAKRFGGIAGRHDHADRRAGRHGRRPAARGDHERRRRHRHRLSTRPGSPAGSSTATSTWRRTTSTTRCAGRSRPGTPAQPLSIGLLGNAAEVLPRMLAMGAPDRRRHRPDLGARPADATCPRGVAFEDMAALRAEDPAGFTERARQSMAAHVAAMVGFMDAGAEVFDYGNSIRGEAATAGLRAGLRLPRLRARLHPAAVLRGQGPVPVGRAVRRPGRHRRHRRGRPRPVPRQRAAGPVDPDGPGEGALPGSARPGSAGSATASGDLAGLRFNELVASRRRARPRSCIGRDHLDCGSVASPYRETEAMADGSDAIADWPLLNALVNTASGASWVCIHHGGGVGIGRSIHAGQVCVADGTALAAEKLERVLTNDPGMGVIRHVDAGYDEAAEVAARRGVRIPMQP